MRRKRRFETGVVFLEFFLISFLLSCAGAPVIYDPPRPMIVQSPVANVRAKPVRHSGQYVYDPLQETQVERGEPVLVYERKGGWARIEALEQLEFTHKNKWEGYPGWVEMRHLSSDMALVHKIHREKEKEEDLRRRIVAFAGKHLGNPYLWGGRSLHDASIPDVATGVDCSGLVNWSYRQAGWFVPRDAHEQYMRSRPIEPSKLKPADLIFLAKKDKPDKIVHVGLYAGDGMILEAPFTGENVRKISVEKRLGKPLNQLENKYEGEKYVVYFGTFFPD